MAKESNGKKKLKERVTILEGALAEFETKLGEHIQAFEERMKPLEEDLRSRREPGQGKPATKESER